MDFSLTADQTMISQTARRIGEKFGLEYWRNLDRNKAFPTEIWAAICEAGLCGVALPEEHGGAGLGMLELALVVENLAAGGGGSTVGQLFMVNPIFGGISIARFGTPDLQRALLTTIGTYWIFEPGRNLSTCRLPSGGKPRCPYVPLVASGTH